jgi:hypothetical protein
MRTFEVYLDIALYPDDANCISDGSDEESFETYKCTEKHTQYVVKYLRDNYIFDTTSEIYFRSVKYDTMYERFVAELVFNSGSDDETDFEDEVDDMNEIVLPGDICDEFYLFIDNKIYYLDIRFTHYVRIDKVEQDQEYEYDEYGEQEIREAELVIREAE